MVATNQQQPPVETVRSESVVDLVMYDLECRRQLGKKRYGTELKTFNGRNPFIDAYQEALDLVIYLRQCVEEFDYADSSSKG